MSFRATTVGTENCNMNAARRSHFIPRNKQKKTWMSDGTTRLCWRSVAEDGELAVYWEDMSVLQEWVSWRIWDTGWLRNGQHRAYQKAVPWLRWLVTVLSLRRPGFTPRSVHVGFVLHKVALGQVTILVLRVSLSMLFHRDSPCSYITWGMNNKPVGGRCSETSPYPIDMNNNNESIRDTGYISQRGGG
jgi:hypothetical protein